MTNINCKDMMRNYLIDQNWLHKIRWPLALLVSIVGINILLVTKKDVKMVYIYLLAIVVTFIIVLLINIFSNTNFTEFEYSNLVRKCQQCVEDPNVKNVHLLKSADFANYTGIKERFTNNSLEEEETSQENFTNIIKKMKNNILNKNTTEEQEQDQEQEQEQVQEQTNEQFNNNNQENNEELPLSSEKIESFNSRMFIEDNMYHETGFPLGDSYPSKNMEYQPVQQGPNQDSPGSMCLLGTNECTPLCSGDTTNPCNIVAPIPGPNWQVQSAESVQNRLSKGLYTPSKCPLGPSVLRKAPNCTNISSNDSRNPTTVECIAAQVPPVYNS